MAFFHKWSGIEKKYTIFETINIYGYTEEDLTEVNLIKTFHFSKGSAADTPVLKVMHMATSRDGAAPRNVRDDLRKKSEFNS